MLALVQECVLADFSPTRNISIRLFVCSEGIFQFVGRHLWLSSHLGL